MQEIQNKIKIFVSAYACEPGLGSEIGVGWHWVLEMSKHFDLWVLTRRSNQSSVETWIKQNPSFSSINFIYFDLPYYLRFWKKGMRGVRTYYNIWQWSANSIVKKTMLQNDIEIFHHLTYGNALWSVSKYGQKQFFVWGPTGGVETVPSEFSKHYNFKGKIVEWLRRMVANSLKYNAGFQSRCKNANLILCKTEILKKNIPSKCQHKATLFTDVAATPIEVKTVETKKQSDIVNYIIVGKLDPWRGFDLLIEAFAMAVKDNPDLHLSILGKGADGYRLQAMIKESNLAQHISMLGKVSMEGYYEKMQESDVVVNTSLKEGAVTTAFDSMSLGLPLICVDTLGYTRYFTDEYAFIIPIQKRDKLILDLKVAILKLADKKLREQMGSGSKKAGQRFTWQARGSEIHKVITDTYMEQKGG
jgi:glycosyltransferase involved in cell wall biosynthesis